MNETPQKREKRGAGAWRVTAIVAGVLLATLLVVLGGGAGVLSSLFASGDAGLSRRVVGAINAFLLPETTRFSCERVHGTILRGAILERPRLLVRRDGREFRWATARRATIEYDLLALLLAKRRTVTVRLDSLEVVFDRDSTGSLIVPTFRRGEGSGAPSTIVIPFELRHASVDFPGEGVRLNRMIGGGTLSVGASGSSLAIRKMRGLLHGADRTAPFDLAGAVAMADTTWRADPLAVALGGSRLTAALDWDPRRGRVREGSLHLAPLILEEALPLFGLSAVAGTLHGDVTFAGLPSDGTASACVGGTLAGEPIDTLLVRATLQPRHVRVDALETRLRGATVTGTGTVAPDGAVVASLRFVNADPSDLPWWKSSARLPSGSMAGNATVRINRARPRPSVRVSGVVTRSRMGRLPIDRASFEAHAPPLGGVVIDTLVLDTPGSRLSGEGAVAADGALRATVIGVIGDLGRMGALTAPLSPREGNGRVVASLSGTVDAPIVRGRATIVRPRTESGLHADTVVVVAAGPLAPTLDLRGSVRVAALATGLRALGDIRADVAGGQPLRVSHFVQSLGDTTLTLAGVLTFEHGGVRADVDSLRLDAGTLHASASGPSQFSFARGRLRASPLTLDLGPGRMELDLDWDVTEGRIDLRGMVEGLDLARLDQNRARRVGGILGAQFLVSGRTADPELSVRGAIVGPRALGVTGDSLRAAIQYAPGIVTLQSLSWRGGTSSARVTGTVRTQRPLEEWLREALRGGAAWRDKMTMALEAEADSFDLAALAPIDSTWQDLEGSARLRARIGGSVASPTLTLTGRAPWLHVRALDGSIAAADLSYGDRLLTIRSLELRQGPAVTTVTGTIPIDLAPFSKERWLRDEPLSLSLRMNETDIAVLPELTNLVAASAGKLSGDAEVRGTLRRPDITGRARVQEGRLRFAGRYEVLDRVTVDGTFDENTLSLTRIDARQGKRGRITGTGTWTWAGAPPLPPGSIGPAGRYRLDIKATDCVGTDREYYLFQFSGAFAVENGATPDGVVKPLITGNAVVSRGDLTMNLAAPANEPRARLPFLYDINAEFPRELRYRQLDTEIDLAGSLQLRNEGDGDIALGTLTVRGGQFYFLTRKFQNLTGEVNFNRLDRFDPDVAIDASTRIRTSRRTGDGEQEDRLIYLAITGRASQLQIRPWVEGGSSSATDLWRELSVGQFVSESDPTVAAGNPLTGVNTLPIGSYLFRNAERWLAGSGFIDTIDLQGGGTGTTSTANSSLIDLGTVGVGKYVTRDLFLKYSRDFSGENDQRISAEYRVTRHLLLRGTQIQSPRSGNPTFQEYNLDLKIRVEY